MVCKLVYLSYHRAGGRVQILHSGRPRARLSDCLGFLTAEGRKVKVTDESEGGGWFCGSSEVFSIFLRIQKFTATFRI